MPSAEEENPATMRRVFTAPAIVVNPSKFDDPQAQRKAITSSMMEVGLPAPAWLETTEADPGRSQTLKAVQDGADVVLACGGDGTVRACAAALSGGRVSLAILPAGTGNLLARNLSIPTDLNAALQVVANGAQRQIDVPALDGEPFVVMAGSGFDALLFERTSEGLKGRIGWAAYAVAGLRAMRAVEATRLTLVVDGRTKVLAGIGVIVGNVGTLTGGMTLLPEAEPDDGLLDVAILTPQRLRHWAGLSVNVLAGRHPSPWQLVTRRSSQIDVSWPHPVPVELDGDLVEPAAHLSYTVNVGALDVCVPTFTT